MRCVTYTGVALEIMVLFIYFKACMGLEMYSGRDMKDACFVNLQKLSLDYYNVTSAGHTLSRVMTDTDRIASCIAWIFPDILWGFAYILGVFGVMLRLSAPLAMTIIIVAPIVVALTVYFQRRLIVLNRDVRAQHSKITSSYNEGIMGAKTSKTLALEGRLTGEFEQTTARAAKAGILHGRMRAIYVPLIVLCGTLAASATLLRGGRMALNGTLSLGVLSAFMTYALSLFQTFRQQAARISQLISPAGERRARRRTDRRAADRCRTARRSRRNTATALSRKRENWEEMRGEVDFDDVSFTYPDGGEEVLTHFSLHVPAGSTVAIVGETGAGKSTLVNLVCRFFEPTGGRVLIDGAMRASAASSGCTATSAMCCNRRICSPARFVRISATADRRRPTKRSTRRPKPSARIASRRSSNRAMTRTSANAATSSPPAKNSSSPSPAR